MLLTSHITGHMLSLKNHPQHCTQWLNKNINANNNYSTYNTKIHQKEKNCILGSKIKVHKFTKGTMRTVRIMRMLTHASMCTV